LSLERLIPGIDASFHFINGIVDDAHGADAMAAFVIESNVKLMAGGTEIGKSVFHVRLISGMHVGDERAGGGEDSEGEGNKEVSEVEFHGFH
jgi:hypothetical protein